MFIVTGGAGFIGSVLVRALNERGHTDILIVDELLDGHKWQNLSHAKFTDIIHKDKFFQWLSESSHTPTGIFHMGACSTTTEANVDFLVENNTHYSMRLFEYCAENKVPYIYASSAATYGGGEQGFSDESEDLRPTNGYGFSKFIFDRWALSQTQTPSFWAGIKFFNVYGPNEYHKGAQASVVYHAFNQIRQNQRLKLFKSYINGVGHGEQKRDFVFVKDVVDIMLHLYDNRRLVPSGIYNAGSGQARTFIDLGTAVFKAMGYEEPVFDWIDMPENIRSHYQYFTEADLKKLKKVGLYSKPLTTLEQGVDTYVKNHLAQKDPYL